MMFPGRGNEGTKGALNLAGIGMFLLSLWLTAVPGWLLGKQDDPHAGHHMPAGGEYAKSVENPRLPDIDLVDMHGQRTALSDVLEPDEPVMLNFIFTTCTAICPVMSATFSQVRQDLGPQRDGLRMISVSIDPEHDTPERLRDYAERYKADDKWQFYTGARGDIVQLQRSLQAYRGNKMNHVPLTFLRPSPASPWIRIEGFASAKDLIDEYRHSLEPRH